MFLNGNIRTKYEHLMRTEWTHLTKICLGAKRPTEIKLNNTFAIDDVYFEQSIYPIGRHEVVSNSTKNSSRIVAVQFSPFLTPWHRF